MEHPFLLASKLRNEGKSFKSIADQLNKAGYLTTTRRLFGQGSTWNLLNVGKKATYATRDDGPALPAIKRNRAKSGMRFQNKAAPQRSNVDTTMLVDVATSNLAEPTKTAVIQLLARSL